MLKQILYTGLIISLLFSCSSNVSSDNVNDTGTGTETTVAMITRIDGTIYETPPQGGGNTADASGGSYGNTYYLITGYKNTGTIKAKAGFKAYTIKIAVPKSNITAGTYEFGADIVADEYYADLDVTGVTPAEAANTTSGAVTITSYNTTTKVLKGNFNFTTNDGVNLTTTSHTLIGSFTFVLP